MCTIYHLIGCIFLFLSCFKTVTLNYCSALGLMEVGVLKKPGHWEYHRMKHPAGPGDNANAVKGAVDMSTADSDDE